MGSYKPNPVLTTVPSAQHGHQYIVARRCHYPELMDRASLLDILEGMKLL